MLEHWCDPSLDPPPPAVASVLTRLAACGIPAYVVGGAVRNRLWGMPTVDWDIAAGADIDRLRQCLGGAKGPGVAYGTVLLGADLQVTAMRREGAYRDGRRPSQVEFAAGLEEDLARRDFTVNAVAWDGRKGLWAVPGARRDLARRCLRAVGEAERRLAEDDLRVIRLARLAAEYGLRIEAGTFAAAWRVGVRRAARERRLQELWRIVAQPPRRWTVLAALGLTPAFELAARWPRLDWAGKAGEGGFSPTVGLFLLLRSYGLRGGAGRAWLRRWPLPRATARALEAGFAADRQAAGVVDPGWREAARLWGNPHASFWRELAAQALGVAAADLAPVRPALGVEDLRARGWTGPRLGAAWREWCRWVARHPEQNSPAELWARLDRGEAADTDGNPSQV